MHNYLALGDSYTIGEGLPHEENFPNQLAEIIRQKYPDLTEPVVIARTGWTTGELWDAIEERQLSETFSFVTLLIGVNNQYRGLSSDNYAIEFERLLEKAIAFADGDSRKVLVLSIPDWGLTPFAEGRDREKIAQEIDAFNKINHHITESHQALYLDITGLSRTCGTDPGHLIADGLHYSSLHYRLWAEKAATRISL